MYIINVLTHIRYNTINEFLPKKVSSLKSIRCTETVFHTTEKETKEDISKMGRTVLFKIIDHILYEYMG
jgi:hypothetical protein